MGMYTEKVYIFSRKPPQGFVMHEGAPYTSEISSPDGQTLYGPDRRTQGVRPESALLGICSSWGRERGSLTSKDWTLGCL